MLRQFQEKHSLSLELSCSSEMSEMNESVSNLYMSSESEDFGILATQSTETDTSEIIKQVQKQRSKKQMWFQCERRI